MGFTYTPNTPVASHFPADDQPVMNQNFQYLNAFGNKDHNLSQNSANANDGYHRQVTFNTNHASTYPAGVSVLYANTASGQSQMFFDNGTVNTQLTTVKASVPSLSVGPPAKGVSFLPGGLLIQWGVSTTNATTFPVAFNAAPTMPIVVTATPTSSANQTFGGVVSIAAMNTGFTFQNNAGSTPTYYWIAIGQA